MIFIRIPTGMLASNCYIVGDQGAGAVIDPGAAADEIVRKAAEAGLAIQSILLTHAHFDHMASMESLRRMTGARVWVHEEDARVLPDGRLNASALFGLDRSFGKADVLLKDGDTVEVGGLSLKIIHTPGHTPGGICIQAEDKVFTGDTLFRMSVGRTDLGNGDSDMLTDSLKKLMLLPDETVVYPGHGASSTIGYERKHNPWL